MMTIPRPAPSESSRTVESASSIVSNARARAILSVDPELLLSRDEDVVVNAYGEGLSFGVKRHLDVESLLLLHLEIVLNIVEGCLFEIFHPLLVLVVGVESEGALLEVDPLGIRLFGVNRELSHTVCDPVLNLLLAKLMQKNAENLFYYTPRFREAAKMS